MSEPSAAAVRATVERGHHDLGIVNETCLRYLAYCDALHLSFFEARELFKRIRDALEFAAEDYAPKRGQRREAVAPDRERSA